MAHLLVVGLNHHVAPLEVRERLALDEARWRAVAPAVPGTVVLSTCNRVEVYAWVEGPSRPASARLTRALATAGGLSIADLRPHLICRSGADALRHLVRVASGLDSLVVGEEQIRGQIRQAVQAADASGQLPPALRGVFYRAAEAARRVRGGTRLGHHPSIATAAVEVARRSTGDLNGASVVVLGAGVMAKAAARHLVQQLGARVVLLNRTPAHATALAAELGPSARVGPLDALPTELPTATLLMCATASRQPVVGADVLGRAVLERDGRALVVLDIAIPRDVEPAARRVPGVQVIDLDDLERLCPVDAAGRGAELARAEALAAAEAQRLDRWLRVRAVSPAIVELREYGERVRAAELHRAATRLKDLTPEQLAAVNALTAGIVNKLLHGPTVALRDAATAPGGQARARSLAVRRLLRPERGRSA